MKNNTNILFIGATHGNETIGVDVLTEIETTRRDFDWIIGNEQAYAKKTREYTADLNRTAPGDPAADIYEKKRSAEIIALSKDYTYTIDIHGTDNDMDTFLIICNSKLENLALAGLIDIPRIVIWPAISEELKHPNSEFFSCGLEIECGNQDLPETRAALKRTLAQFLDTYTEQQGQPMQDALAKKELYEVYDVVRTIERIDPSSLKEFMLVEHEEPWYPLFIDAYNDIVCYKMRRISVEEILSL